MCYKPRTLKSGSTFPCGKCAKCKSRRISAWSFRLLQELQASSSAHFLTLTYDNYNVPYTPLGYMGLSYRDLEKFYKRLRKSHFINARFNKTQEESKIKYYSVGEYGGRTIRPHYHILLFNANIELINDAWNKGDVYYGKVEGASIGYCLKYMCKPSKFKLWCKYNGMPVEKSTMSKGIGISYLNEQMCQWHANQPVDRMYCLVEGNKKIAMPRYYKDKLYFEQERANIRDAGQLVNEEKWLNAIEKWNDKDWRKYENSITQSLIKLSSSSLKTVI